MSDDDLTDLAPERAAAITAMRELGWSARRLKEPGKHPKWMFRRGDVGGLDDLIRIKQADINMDWVARQAMACGDAPCLVAQVWDAKRKWLKDRFGWSDKS